MELDERAEMQLDRLILVESMCRTEMGKTFLKWLCLDLIGWGKSATTSDQSRLHDLWIVIRRYVPVQVLGEIEFANLVKEPQDLRKLLDTKPLITETESDQP